MLLDPFSLQSKQLQPDYVSSSTVFTFLCPFVPLPLCAFEPEQLQLFKDIIGPQDDITLASGLGSNFQL